jgi:Flp pilus assembly protein CpaB
MQLFKPVSKEIPMRRGRIFIYLALIIVVGITAAGIWWWKNRTPPATTTEPQATAGALSVEIVTAGQNIYPGTKITEAMLNTIQISQEDLVVGEYTNVADVVGLYAKLAITQGVPLVSSMFTATPGTVNLPGSTWSGYIPQGLTAVSIPITRLTSVAYGIRDGDYVNVIVTFMLVDVDAAYQTILPNSTGAVVTSNGSALLIGTGTGEDATTTLQTSELLLNLTAQSVTAGLGGPVGRVEYNEDLQQPFYVLPSEQTQRPRMVTQMIMQNIQILHVGTFPLPGETVSDQLNAPTPAPEITPTPVPAQTEQTVAVIVRPDIITLMVPNQDAVTLIQLVYSGAQITLTLRNPNDQVVGPQPDAATLEYLLTQYNIPVPAKLPYALEPRTVLEQPTLANDVPVQE